MSSRLYRIMVAICGILGVVALMASFSINPAPPAGASIAQIVVWGKEHQVLIEAGAWLQGIGSLLEVIFMLGLLQLAGATRTLAGLVTAFAATVIVGISFVEVSFYLSAIAGGVSGDMATLGVSLNLIKAIQHAYVIAPAPANLIAIGIVLYRTRLVHRVFSYIAFVLGVALVILGFIGTFTPMQNSIDIVLSVQEVWYLAIAITLIATARAVAANVKPVQSVTVGA
ncbi:hypothetical protein KDA_37420 [Dictyobacter alpinus]|uniref:DUF4386 domain-containing protein n=1 Tax=Dictyobacter alpinus TaxID=2014873 RepID=A0A402BA49_9CHLR|nr:hypothetical protein [Dictyobacter alpinus]GCE28258.1 hypothetical protein KDA_37420 [Dictyobacter alpinus]